MVCGVNDLYFSVIVFIFFFFRNPHIAVLTFLAPQYTPPAAATTTTATTAATTSTSSGTMKIPDPAEKMVVFFLKMAKNGLFVSFYFSGTMEIQDPAEKMVVFFLKMAKNGPVFRFISFVFFSDLLSLV